MGSIRKSNNNAKRKQRRLNHKSPGTCFQRATWTRWKFNNLKEWRWSQYQHYTKPTIICDHSTENPFFRCIEVGFGTRCHGEKSYVDMERASTYPLSISQDGGPMHAMFLSVNQRGSR